MSSLAEVYEGRVGEYASLRRLYLGVGAFSVGVLLVVAGIAVAATGLATGGLGWSLAEAREAAGLLAGLGLPAAFLGVLAVMPTSRRTQAAAVVGAGVAVLGVALFSHAYPCHWSGARCVGEHADLTLPATGVYFLGALTTFWCLFTGVANFKARNDPGGTVSLEITRQGETRVVEVPRSQVEGLGGSKGSLGGVGGVGFLGNTPDGSVETQTNRSEGPRRVDGDAGTVGEGGAGTVSDGGATERAPVTPLRDDAGAASPERGPAGPGGPVEPSAPGADGAESVGDAYCGSCGHFQYVRTEQGMQPYCGLHDDLMDDMEACDDWSPR